VRFYTETFFEFFEPPLGALGQRYDVHLRLIGKLALDFLLVIIELFSLGVTAASDFRLKMSVCTPTGSA